MNWFQEAATALITIAPIRNQVLEANLASCRLFRRNRLEMLGAAVSQLFMPSFKQLIVFTEETLHKGEAWSDQLYVQVADEVLRVEVWSRATTDAEESILHLSLSQADFMQTQRERAEAQRHYLSGLGHWNRVSRVFQEFERENQLLLDAAGEGIYGVDAEGKTTFVNPAAERILGYSAQELAGRNMHAMVHHSHSDGSDFPAEHCPIFEAFRDGAVHSVEDDVFWSKTGERIDVEYTSTPIRDNGFLVGAVIIFRDVSQKKADRRRLLEALEEVEKLKARLELENAYLQEELSSEFNHHQIVGKSPAVQNILQQISLVAPTEATVLICGESGTGKELIARAIHEQSDRSNRPMIRVNCAAIPEDLFESEFFGHIKGAFTGALKDRPGRFELADGGTLFLDEVGEIPLHLQGKLLRVLQEQQFERIGDTTTRHVDVRIIAATNQDLKALAQQGRFREDLYFRLNVFPIESVPLRQRKEDIPLLTQHFLEQARRHTKNRALRIPLGELEKLKHYNWPGNIRELENVIERHAILARSDTLHFSGLEPQARSQHEAPLQDPQSPLLTEQARRELEIQSIVQALKQTRGKVSGANGAAELLQLKPTTLASRIRKLGIDPREFARSGA